MMNHTYNSPLQQINHPLFDKKNISVYIKRDDLIHPFISGNKYRKLMPVMKHYINQGFHSFLTFGGAYSNHIHAFAYTCYHFNLRGTCIIRGEELAHKPLNDTLSFVKDCGVELVFVSRKKYKKRYNSEYQSLLSKQYNSIVIPEGGTHPLSHIGFKHLIDELNQQVPDYNFILTASGSGGTAGGINRYLDNQILLSFPVVKGIENDLTNTFKTYSSNTNYDFISDYHFGGYGKVNKNLIDFIIWFNSTFDIQLEQVYTGKMFFGFFDLIKKDYFPKKSKVVLLHTGGIQGLNLSI